MNVSRWVMALAALLLLSGTVTAQETPVPPTDTGVQTTIGNVVSDPGSFIGQTVTLQGVITELVNVRAFILSDVVALVPNSVLVVNNSGRPFDLNLTANQRIVVTGIVHEFTRDENFPVPDYQNEYYQNLRMENLNLYDRPFDPYTGYTVIEVTNMDYIIPAATIDEIIPGAAPFDDGRIYVVDGYVGDVIGGNAFVLHDGNPLTQSQVIVFAPTDAADETVVGVNDLARDQLVRVYGTITQFGDERFETAYNRWGERYGLNYSVDYDPEAFVDLTSEWEAIFATRVVPITGEP